MTADGTPRNRPGIDVPSDEELREIARHPTTRWLNRQFLEVARRDRVLSRFFKDAPLQPTDQGDDPGDAVPVPGDGG